MIRPRWNRHANALLANLGGSPRTASFQHRQQYHAPSRLMSGRASQWRNDIGAPGGGHGDGLPSRRELDKARRELLKIDRPNPRSRSPAWPQLERKFRPGKDDTDVEYGRHKGQAHNAGKRRGSTSGDSAKTPASQQVWPQLKRRSPQNDKDRDVLLRHDSSTSNKDQLVESPQGEGFKIPKIINKSSCLMLIIDGLSPNLDASDFYRLAPNELSNWKSVIQKVQQQRDPRTLEPLGRYFVSFSTPEAAVFYRDRLLRLHQLSSLKLKSATGLWESTVPASLRAAIVSSSAKSITAPDVATPIAAPINDDLTDLVDSFTLAPGSQDAISSKRKRVAVKRPWTKDLAEAVEPLGYGGRPHVLLLDVYPPILTAKELFTFIRLDGHNRGLRWQVCMPIDLKAAAAKEAIGDTADMTQQESRDEQESEADVDANADKPSFRRKDHDTWEKLKSRFVLVCADESEARRFQRSWNNRALTTSRPRPGRFIVHASIIKW